MASKKSERERLYKPPAEQRQHIAKQQQQQATGRIAPTSGAPRTVLKSYTSSSLPPLHYQDVGPVPPAPPPIESEMQALPELVTREAALQTFVNENESLLPEPSLEPIRRIWRPFVDPRREPLTDFGRMTLLRRSDREDVQVGDLFPNLQDALAPMFRPRATVEAEGGVPSTEEVNFAEAVQRVGMTAPWLLAAQPAQGAAAVQRALDVAQRQIAGGAGQGPLRTAGAVLAGTPRALINTADTPARVVEHAIGSGLATVGVDINPIQTHIGPLTGPLPARVASTAARLTGSFVARVASTAARAIGMEKIADRLAEAATLEPSLTAELVANAIARGRDAGRDTTALENVLEILAPQQDREAMIEQQARFIALEPGEGRLWDVAEWTYEGGERVVEAAEKMARGESWEQVSEDIESDLAFRERARDFVGQIVYDPLNLFDFGLKLGPLGGGVAERVRKWAGADVRRLLVAAPEGRGVQVLETFGDILPANFFESLPLVGRLVSRTDAARAWRVAEESAGLVQTLTASITPDAARRLADVGIDAHPAAVALELLRNPNADNVLRSGRSADEIAELLGIGARQATDFEVRTFGLAPGSTLDLLRSEAADRTRYLLDKMGADPYDKLKAVREQMYDALRTGKVADREAAEVALTGWLEMFDATVKKALGIEPPSGPFSNLRQAMNAVQGFFVNFHMRWNPGWAIRNIANNTVTLLLDRVNVITPRRSVRQALADLDLLSPQMARSIGAGSDAIKPRGPFANVLNFVYRFSSDGEREAGYRALLTGFQRTFDQYWVVGRAIPAQEWAAFASKVDGDTARAVQALVENARTPKQLAAVRAMITQEDAWRVVADPDLLRRLTQAELDADVLGILNESGSLADALNRIDNYVQEITSRVIDVAQRQPALDGTEQAEVVAAVNVALDGLTKEAQEEFYNAFWKELATFYAQRDLLKSWAEQAVDKLAGKFPADFTRLVRSLENASGGRRAAMEAGWRQQNMQVTGLIREGRFDELAAIDPVFQGVNNPRAAWNRHALWAETFWRDLNADIIQDIERIGDEAMALAGVDIPKPDIGEVRRFVPLTRAEQRTRWAHLLREWEDAVDDSIPHLRNFLRKEGILKEERFFSTDIVNDDWYQRALDAIRKRAAREKPVARGATPLTDEYMDFAGWERPVVPDTPAFDAQAFRRQMDELHVQRAELIGRWRNELDPDEAARLRAQIDELYQQIQELRRQLRAGAQPEADIVVPSRRRRWPEEPRPRQPLGVSPFEEAVAMLDSDQFAKLNETPGDVQAQWAKFIEQNKMGVDEAVEWLANQLDPLPDIPAPRPVRAPLLAEEPPAPRTPPIRDSRGMPADAVGPEAALATARLTLLQEVADHITARAALKNATLTPDQVKALDDLIKTLEPRMAGMRTVATNVGGAFRDFALHNYSDRRGFDLAMGLIYNYPFWYTRTMANYVRRAMDSPGAVAALLKLYGAIERVNRDKPEWFRDQIEIQTALGPMNIPIMSMVHPLNGFLGDKFHDADLDNTVPGQVLSRAQMYGPGLHASISTLMALWAYARGERDEALGWQGYMGQPTRAINAMSVIAKSMGADFIPPGGIVLEPWLWVSLSQPLMGYDKWEARRIGLGLADLVGTEVNGQIVTMEMAYDAMLNQSGPIFEAALQKSKEARAAQTFFSWMFGAGVKWRPEIDVEVQRMDALRRELYLRRDEMSPEQYRQAWAELERRYPWADLVIGFRRDETERHDVYAWSVFNRLPPNARPYYNALGLTDEEYDDLINTFYENKSVSAFNDAQREQFMIYMRRLGAILALPSEATSEEWRAARAAFRAMSDRLERRYPGAADKEAFYYHLMETADREVADAYLANPENGDLLAYWDDRNRERLADPLLAKYYGSMDRIERLLEDEFEREMADKYPGIHDLLDEYYTLPAGQRGDFIDLHPELSAYWTEKDLFTLRLDEELEALAEPIRQLQPRWAQLREDATFETAGQRTVAEMIASGRRPLGDFVLPEDLDARQLQASINIELSSIPDGAWGTVYRALREMGDLDDILTAYQEWGRGSTGVDAVIRNEVEVRALLAALGTIRENGGWALLTEAQLEEPRSAGGTGTGGGGSSGGGGSGGRGGGDPYTLTNYAAGATDVDQYVKILQTERWATNEVKDIEAYLNDVLADGTWQTRSLMDMSADTRRMMQDFLNATAGAEIDPAAVRAYLESAVVGNDPMAGLDALPPEIQQAAAALGTAFLAEFNERLGGGSSGGGGRRSGGRVRSDSYGGETKDPQTDAEAIERRAQVHTFLTTLRRRSPAFWAYLRDLSRMTAEEAAAFLSDPKYRHFKNWLIRSVFPTFGPQIKDIIEYFKSPPTQGERQRYNNYVRSGASQRFSQRYTA